MRRPVYLDVGPAAHQQAGLSRYAERLAWHLLRDHSATLDLTLVWNAHSGHHLPESLQPARQLSVPMGQYPWRLSALISQALRRPFPPLERPIRAQAGARTPIYHATEHLLPYVTCPTILTVHDLIFERYPEHHTRRNVLFLRAALPRFVRSARAIIAVSEQTRRDLIELYGTPAAKIRVIREGVDERFVPASAAEVERVSAQWSPNRPWLLMVGTLEPRKNHATALWALRRLADEGFPHRLLIVGGSGWLFAPVAALVDELGLQERVTFTGYVPLSDLLPLYAGADAFLMPSLYEGFGFPLLEALACGAPSIASSASSLPEVGGDAALYVPPLDAQALVDALRLVLTQPELAQTLRERGPRRAARFRWERCAEETATLYAEVASRLPSAIL